MSEPETEPGPDHRPPRLLPAPPNVYALITRPWSDDSAAQQWYLMTVVGFEAHDGEAYVVGGMNRTGKLDRISDVLGNDEFAFKLAGMWEQDKGGKEAATEWARKHIEAVHEDAMPFEIGDPRREAEPPF
jgi:hypothetical protein